jgi:hypothetical protein
MGGAAMSAKLNVRREKAFKMDASDQGLFRAFTAERDALFAQTSKASPQEQASLRRQIAVREMLLGGLLEGH